MNGNVRDDEKVDRWVGPPADISPVEFERFVADVLEAGGGDLASYTVQTHEGVAGQMETTTLTRRSVSRASAWTT